MKIIGGTGDGFVVTVTKDELANLAGFGGSYGMERERGYKELRVGEVVPVCAIFKESTETLAAYGEIKKNLSSVQNQTARLLSLMQRPSVEEKKP